jgi:hypothetical protein
MAEPPRLPDRLQRDLEDALREGGVDKLPARPRRRRRAPRLHFPDPRPKNPGHLVLIGVVVAVLAFLVPGLPYRGLLLALGIGSVLLAVVTHFMQPGGHPRHYWRGRYLDLPSARWQERLYRIIYRNQ